MRSLMIRPSRYNLAADIDGFFNDFWRPFISRQGEFVPATDIEETDKEFALVFELPGMKKDDIKISVEDGVLTVSGEKTEKKEEEGRRRKKKAKTLFGPKASAAVSAAHSHCRRRSMSITFPRRTKTVS